MHGLLRCNIKTGVHAHAHRTNVSLRDVKIARDGNKVLVTSRAGSAQRIWGDFEKVWELRWDLLREKTFGFRLLAETFMAGATRVGVGGGADEKARIERLCLSLSLYVEETLNSKVINIFVPEQRSREVFFEFRDSYVLFLWTLYVHFTHSHIMAMVQIYHNFIF